MQPSVPESSATIHSAESKSSRNLVNVGLFSLIAATGTFWFLLTRSGPGLPALLVIVFVQVLFALFGLSVLTRGIREKMRWHPVEVHFAQWPLALGSSTTITVIRASKRRLPDAAEHTVTARVICDEVTLSGSGDSARLAHNPVVDEEMSIAGSIVGNRFVGTAELYIPVDGGGPSLNLSRNKLEWRLGLELEDLAVIPEPDRIPVTVVSELDPSAQDSQDAPLAQNVAITVADAQTSIQLQPDRAEVGGFFNLSVKRRPTDSAPHGGNASLPRAIKVRLEYRTSGSKFQDTGSYDTITIPLDRFGSVDTVVQLPVPDDCPVSYRGSDMSVEHTIRVSFDIENARDLHEQVPVAVIPKGGTGTYRDSHPLPK